MNKVNIGIIGTGWCGGIRAEACAASPYVSELHIAEIKEERLKEVAAKTKPVTATTDYRTSARKSRTSTPSSFRRLRKRRTIPMAKESLLAGKHVFLEKPIALELSEADELIALARSKSLLFTIGYSQRFNPKFAYVKRSIEDGTIGQPVSALVSRHITRNLGNKIGGRIKLSPAAMEATHDIDFVLWCFAPSKTDPRLCAGSAQNHEADPQRSRIACGSWSRWTTDAYSPSARDGCFRRLIPISPPPGSRWSAPKARSWWTTRIATWL